MKRDIRDELKRKEVDALMWKRGNCSRRLGNLAPLENGLSPLILGEKTVSLFFK